MTAATTLIALALVGCGTDQTEDAEPAGEPTPEAAEQTTEEEPADEPTSEAAEEVTGDEPTEEAQPAAAGYSQECGEAMQAAAELSALVESLRNTDPAIIACASVEAFTQAANDNPEVLDSYNTDVTTWLANRCLDAEDEDVTSSAICAEIES